ncbi:nucleotidyltransferase substrate binding protein [uncultured Megasphaera sp.]|uniref:nucleotidyltransferase substrate binding protein n=1 Tax=uncultured Megasphaera sp. TaxID=165188 RepID=UPI0025EA8959|nr:nucleotidyltransferase substrate binding protein [uncultured Megasphaera sp.]
MTEDITGKSVPALYWSNMVNFMEKITEQHQLAINALGKFHALAFRQNLNDIERDALLQRFQFTVAAVLQYAGDYLHVHQNFDVLSPKRVIRACSEKGILTTEEAAAALKMVDDWNAIAHADTEEFLESLLLRLPLYDSVMHSWLEKIK